MSSDLGKTSLQLRAGGNPAGLNERRGATLLSYNRSRSTGRGIAMKRRNLCCIGVGLLLLIPAIGRAQSAEQVGHCTELIKRSSQLLDGEQTISMMAAYRKGTLTFGSEDLKNELLRKMEALAREKSTHDLDVLRKEQLKDILRNERQYLADCSGTDTNKRYRASTLYTIGRVLIEQDQTDDAIPILQRCVTTDPDYALCWEELGEASASLGKVAEAKGFFKKAIEVGAFDETNAAAIKTAKYRLFMLEHPGGDPMCAPGMPGLSMHLDQCREYLDPAPSEDVKTAGTHSFGTGFFVSNQGYILTNNHVVAGCKNLATGDGKPLRLLNKNARSDLALLKADFMPTSVAMFRSGPSPKLEDAVVAFGFPLPGILFIVAS
jgi:tetratricopeptide (TPR) repeat protein